MSNVTVIDYGIGNLLSVCRALEHIGAHVTLTSDPEQVRNAQRIVLPGVGAFGDGMQALEERRLSEAIREAAAGGVPVLGICLGAQMLLDSSEEFGDHLGLGLIPGKVLAIPDRGISGEALNVPHMGWANLSPANDHRFESPLLAHTAPDSAVYFVHSFQAHPHNPADIAAVCDYAGNRLTAMVRHDNVFGCQFHPEKSGPVGLGILKRFLEIAA
jgi:glutamine amidotransferase